MNDIHRGNTHELIKHICLAEYTVWRFSRIHVTIECDTIGICIPPRYKMLKSFKFYSIGRIIILESLAIKGMPYWAFLICNFQTDVQ